MKLNVEEEKSFGDTMKIQQQNYIIDSAKTVFGNSL